MTAPGTRGEAPAAATAAGATPPGPVVLEVEDLSVAFPGAGGPVRVVDGVSFTLRRGEVLGVVGESGSGKTMTARSLLGLLPAGAQVGGRILVQGREVSGLAERDWARLRGQAVGMVFQDAMSGLNPVRTIGGLLVETIRNHRRVGRAEARRQAIDALAKVGLPAPEERFGAYPHQLSGGMRQRVMIAFAIVNEPAVLVADEPTTALDATVQAQIVERLRVLARGSGLILITHDLGVAATMCDRVLVLYAGRVAEVGAADQVLTDPRHPYTAGLLAAVPRFDRDRAPLLPIAGTPAQPSEVGAGCPFAPRCTRAQDDCQTTHPPLTGTGGRLVACYHPVPQDPPGETKGETKERGA